MAIFKTQDLLDITLQTNVDLTGATVTDINYLKPGGDRGTWSGSAFDTTKIKYEVQPGDIDEFGLWKLQAEITIGGRTGLGEIVEWQIEEIL